MTGRSNHKASQCNQSLNQRYVGFLYINDLNAGSRFESQEVASPGVLCGLVVEKNIDVFISCKVFIGLWVVNNNETSRCGDIVIIGKC